MKTPNTFNPEAEAVLQYVPDFQTSTFTVTGLGETLLPIAESIKADEAQPVRAVAHVETPLDRVTIQNAYEDLSTLAPRETIRRKISAFIYDKRNGTNMLDLLNERIADDRDVAFARNLGILGVTHCAKHEKAVAKLKQLV